MLMRSDRSGNPQNGASSTKSLTKALTLAIIDDYDPAQRASNPSDASNESSSPPKASTTQLAVSPPKPIAQPKIAAVDPMLESAVFVMIPTPIPLKHRRESDYERISGNLSRSFHDIFKMHKLKSKHPDSPSLYFFKQNKYEKSDAYMYELEAATCAFYHLLAPDHTPTARALFDNATMQYVGVVSKNLDGFKTTLDDPLREEDLIVDALKFCSIEDLDNLDERARLEKYDLNRMPPTQVIYEWPVKCDDNTVKRIPITAKDLRNYRIIKGLAIGLTTTHIFCEDDCHTGNITKDGKRIDFDMSPWPITSKFKKTGPVDWTFRDPTNRFPVTARDIESFPNLRDAQPFYWPTFPVRVLPEAFISIASNFFNVSRNAFHSKDNAIYQQLEHHPVFIHHKFATLLKFILTSPAIYHRIATLHVREESAYQNTSIISMLTDFLDERLSAFQTELLKLPSFKKFLEKNGDRLIKNILVDFAIQNDRYAKKMEATPLYQLHLIKLDQVVKDYANLCAKLSIVKNPDRVIQADEEIQAMIEENNEDLKKSFRF